MNIPKAEVPYPLEGYEFPETEENLVSWSQVMEKLVAAHDYWVCTVSPGWHPTRKTCVGCCCGREFVCRRQSRGAVGEEFVCSWAGGDSSAGLRPMRSSLRGTAVYIADDKELIAKTDAAYSEKYNIPHGPVWQIRPKRAFAWIGGMHTVTRWRFD